MKTKPSHKVLMTLMGMEIGGAETHVLELSKTLKHMGLDVHVVSNGGVYVKELEDCGIKHYRVPLHNKQFINVFSSYKALKKIIVENDIKLVHAHARIPAFICGLLQKRLKFKLVTSAHLDFSVAFPFNLLSNWGDKVLAVSSDIRDYLLSNYKVQEGNISLTVNAIDTIKFNPDIDYQDIITALGLQQDSLKIVCVSRMDSDRNLAARILIQIAPNLVKATNKKIEIILVGDGNQLDQVKEMAAEANRKIGHKRIHTPGSRTDVNKFMSMADIFVNVSRSALEAMAAATPTILAGTGNQGYLGIMSEATKAVAVETNFTCRGCGQTTPEKMEKDLLTLINMPPEALKSIGQYSRNLILSEYSLERMAKDAIKVYDNVFENKKPTNVVISGYYGYNNSGDDTLLKSILRNIRAYEKNLNLTVLSMKPKETRAKFHVDTVHRFNILAVFMRLRRANLLITGGGNLIQDETSTQSLLYYLWVINTARFLGAKNMLYAKGIGPVSSPGNIRRVRKSIDKVDLITLRESGSKDVLEAIGITRPAVHITADAAFALPPSVGGEDYVQRLGITREFFCIALRPWANNPDNLEAEIATFADFLCNTYNYQAVFVPMRPEQDTDIARRVISLMKNPGILMEEKGPEVERMVLGLASFAVCMRLHALIYAMEKGVPAIGLDYGTKIHNFMEEMGQKWHVPIEKTRADILIDYAKKIHANKAEISTQIYQYGASLREKSAENARLCIELLEKE